MEEYGKLHRSISEPGRGRKRKREEEWRPGGKRDRRDSLFAIRSFSHSASGLEEHQEVHFDPYQHFKVVTLRKKLWKSAVISESVYKIVLTKPLPNKDPLMIASQINQVMSAAFNMILSTCPAEALSQLFVVNSLFNLRCIATKRARARDLSFESVSERIMNALNSDEAIKLSETTFHLSISHLDPAVGGVDSDRTRLSSRQEYSVEVWARGKKSLYNPMTERNRIQEHMSMMCVPLCLAYALYSRDNPGVNALNNYLRSTKGRKAALEVVNKAGLSPALGPFKISQLPAFLNSMPEGVGINFFDSDSAPFLSVGSIGPQSVNIFLALLETENGSECHYHAFVIKSLPGFYATKHKVCCYCFKTYDTGGQHKCCEAGCRLCKFPECLNRDNAKRGRLRYTCETCGMHFNTSDCLDAHTCTNARICQLCGGSFDKNRISDHKCGLIFCQKCKILHTPFDQCFVQVPLKKKRQVNRRIWYGDIETFTDPVTGNHRANLIVLCLSDNSKTVEYTGPNAIKDFTKECIVKHSIFAKSYIVWHNASAFDGHLWYAELLRMKCPPKAIIKKQQRIIMMELAQNDIICRDSLLFLPGTALHKFTTMCGLTCGPKGCFPFGLNGPKWIDFGKHIIYKEIVDGVEHRFPKIEYFMPESKGLEQLADLRSWHAERVLAFAEDPNLEYCPEDELLLYCRQDVRILREGLEKYRLSWLSQYPDYEMLDSVTLPSYINLIFRSIYLRRNSLAILPPLGYAVGNQKYSWEGLAWVSWICDQLGLSQVRHARSGYECKVAGNKVDGTGVDPNGLRYVLNYHGCFWHGHDCIKDRSPVLDIRQHNTKLLDSKLFELSKNPKNPFGEFVYICIYQCEFKELLRENVDMREYYEKYKDMFCKTPLQPRDAMRGGRTNAIKHRVIVDQEKGHKMYYLDFTSLYPAVMFGVNGEVWPEGHPTVFIGVEIPLRAPPITSWFGLVFLQILPPKQLCHPVLGQIVNNRYLFHLCTRCAQEQIGGFCDHSDEDRVLEGTWFTGEILLALQYGYQIVKVHELWHWGPGQQSSDLFKGLIRDQYARKALSSAVPNDPHELKKLIQEYKDTMDLDLDPSAFVENKASRASAKFCVNNIW